MQTEIAEIKQMVAQYSNGRAKGSRWPEELKKKVIELHSTTGLAVNKIARLTGLNAKNIYAWKAKFGFAVKRDKRSQNVQVIDVHQRCRFVQIIICLGRFELRVNWH